MKTTIKWFIIPTFLLLMALSISTQAISLSDVKKENRKVADFNELSFALPGNLFLTQGSKNEVIIEADEDLLEKIETEVRGNTLSIGFEKWYNYRGFGEINVYVTVKDISKLILSGSGDVIAQNQIKSEQLGFVLSGSGKIMIDDLVTNEVTAVITGSGDIKIKGKTKAKELSATITGSGDFEAYDIAFDEADLTITGSGSIRATVIDELDANITGSGRIYYKGKPLIDAYITGSGKIRSED